MPPAAEETQIQNRPLRPAWRSDFGLGRRSRVFSRSGNTNPREKRVRISRHIRDSRGRSSWSMQRVSLEIDFSGLRCGAISALAVDQVYLVGPETPIRARKGSEIAEISAIQGVLLKHAGGSHWKSTSAGRWLTDSSPVSASRRPPGPWRPVPASR